MTDPITITEIPAITPLPVIDRTQPPSVVRPQVDTYFGTQLPTFTGQLNAVSEAIVQLGQDVLALRQATAADKSAAEGFKTQAGLYASAADTSRGLAAAEKEAAALERAAAEDARDDAQDARDAAQTFATAAGASVGLPAPLASKPLAALRVNAAGNGLEATYEAPAGDVKHIPISASATLAAAQKGALIDVSGAGIALTLNASALGNGWWCYLRNIGTAAVTASADAGQTIDGIASGVIKPGMTLLVQCDGANFHCVRVGPKCVIEVLTSGTSWTVPLGVRSMIVRAEGGGAGGYSNNTPQVNYQYNSRGAGGVMCLCSTTPGAVATYSIGAPSSHVTASTGVPNTVSNGGNTTFALGGVTSVAFGGVGYGNSGSRGGDLGGRVGVTLLGDETPGSHPARSAFGWGNSGVLNVPATPGKIVLEY